MDDVPDLLDEVEEIQGQGSGAPAQLKHPQGLFAPLCQVLLDHVAGQCLAIERRKKLGGSQPSYLPACTCCLQKEQQLQYSGLN